MNKDILYLFGGALSIAGFGWLANYAAAISLQAFAAGAVGGIPVGILLLISVQSWGRTFGIIAAIVDEQTQIIVNEIMRQRNMCDDS